MSVGGYRSNMPLLYLGWTDGFGRWKHPSKAVAMEITVILLAFDWLASHRETQKEQVLFISVGGMVAILRSLELDWKGILVISAFNYSLIIYCTMA